MIKAFMSDSHRCFGGFQNQSQRTWCAIWQSQPFRFKSAPCQWAIVMTKGAENPLERSLVFLGWVVAGFVLTILSELIVHISFKLTVLSELIILIDLRLLNSKPPRKAKKVKQPALKRPAKASRKRPAAASPQIPVPRPQIPSIKCRNHFFCIVADGSTSAGPGWVSGRRRKLWRTWWH